MKAHNQLTSLWARTYFFFVLDSYILLDPIMARGGQMCPTKPTNLNYGQKQYYFFKTAWWQFLNLPKDSKNAKQKRNGFALVWTSFWWFTMGRANLPFPGHLCNSGSLARIGLKSNTIKNPPICKNGVCRAAPGFAGSASIGWRFPICLDNKWWTEAFYCLNSIQHLKPTATPLPPLLSIALH